MRKKWSGRLSGRDDFSKFDTPPASSCTISPSTFSHMQYCGGLWTTIDSPQMVVKNMQHGRCSSHFKKLSKTGEDSLLLLKDPTATANPFVFRLAMSLETKSPFTNPKAPCGRRRWSPRRLCHQVMILYWMPNLNPNPQSAMKDAPSVFVDLIKNMSKTWEPVENLLSCSMHLMKA